MSPAQFNIGALSVGGGRTLFVVEEGQANMGRFEFALKMIEEAAITGADAIEFQLATAADFYVRDHRGYAIYKDREFSDLQLKQLCDHAKENKIELIVAPFSLHVIESMTKYGASGFNINGSDLTNPEILDAVAKSGLPFFLSILLADEAEVDWAVARIRANAPNAEFGLLLGQHTMASGGNGVALEHTNLGYIKSLKKKYSIPVGFIDHTPHIWTPSLAVASGADLITKHLAISREDEGPDWKICLEPDEMITCIEYVRGVEVSLENTEKILAPGEDVDRGIMRRSIVASRALKAGTILSREDFVFRRPGTGMSPDQYAKLIGRKLTVDLIPDAQFSLDIIDEEKRV